MNASNNVKLAAKKAAGINIHLFSDDHPETTVKGTGFKNADTAYRTIEIVKQKPRNRQVWTINAMYYRAKHHPNQTEAMRDAMKIYKSWLDEYNKEKEKEKKNKKAKDGDDKTADTTNKKMKQSQSKRKLAAVCKTDCDDDDNHDDNDNDDGDKKSKKKRKISTKTGITKQRINSSIRSELEVKYKTMFNISLPKIAREEKWPIRLNHCLMRVALDAYWQCCWYEKLDQKKGALKSMTIPQIENVIVIGLRMIDEGKSYVARLNKESLAYRGKHGPGKLQKEVKGEIDIKKEQKPKITRTKKTIDAAIALVKNEGSKYDTDAVANENLASHIPAIPISSSNLIRADENSSGNNIKNKNEDNNEKDKQRSDDDFNADALLQVQPATSGRSACRACKEKIGKGQNRIGMKVWSSGRSITVWHCPLCFIDHAVCVEKVTRGSSARCKYTGLKFQKGDLRVILQVGLTKSYYHALSALKPLLAPVYDILLSTEKKKMDEEGDTPIPSKMNINGFDKLDNDDRATILACLQ